MTKRIGIPHLVIALALAATTGGCLTVRGSEGRGAMVNMSDPNTRAAVSAALAAALHRQSVELGPTQSGTSIVTVLPPPPGPYEKNSPVLPIRFAIVRQDGKCRAVREDTMEAFDLPGVDCTAAR